MKTPLIAVLALATSTSALQVASTPVREASAAAPLGSAAEHGLDFVRGGITVFDYLSPATRADVRLCRLTDDATRGIQAAVTAAASGSRRVVLSDGCYRITATIMLPSEVTLVGASMRATKIMPAGDFPAIVAAGTYVRGLTGVAVQNMSIICAGMTNPHAMGIKLVYVNRGMLNDLYFNGCRHALDLYDQWQTRIDNVTADGVGSQQNDVGIYMGAPTDRANKAPNNAVILSNSTMQNVARYGYQLTFFAGSKFLNDEAMNGITGWKLCGERYDMPGQPCQFGHFVNIVADTTSGPGIVVDQGSNASPVNNVLFDQVWIGSSTLHALYLAGVTYSQFDGIHVTRADDGVYLHNSNNLKISTNVAGYNRNANGSHAAVISGGSENTLWATNTQSDHPTGYNGIAEIGPTHGNSIWGGLAVCNAQLAFGPDGTTSGLPDAVRSCSYEVQGRQVRMTFHLGLATSGTRHGQAYLRGLPVAADTGPQDTGAAGAILAKAMKGLGGTVITQVVPGSIVAALYSQGSTGPMPLTSANFTASSTLSGTLEYTKR